MKIEKKVTRFEEEIDFRKIKLKKTDVFSRKDITEVVRKTYYEGKRLVRFRTVRKEEGAIIESGYAVNGETGEIEQISSGIYYEKNNLSFHASKRYPELNKFLEKLKNESKNIRY